MGEVLQRQVSISQIVKTVAYIVVLLVTVTGSYIGTYSTLESHVSNSTVHMTLDKRIEIFVTRQEYNALKQHLDQQHKETMEALREIRAKQR